MSRPKFPNSFMLFVHNSTPLWLLEICLSIFVVRCSSSKVKTVPNLGMSRLISLTKLSSLGSAAPFTRTSHYSTLNSNMKKINVQLFHNTHTKKKLVGYVWI